MATTGDQRIRITEYLDLDLDRERWLCNRCDRVLGPARENYKRGCLLYDRDPREVHLPIVQGDFSFAPDPLWVRIVEFYCPGCGVQIETEYLPPGHPLTHAKPDEKARPAGRKAKHKPGRNADIVSRAEESES